MDYNDDYPARSQTISLTREQAARLIDAYCDDEPCYGVDELSVAEFTTVRPGSAGAVAVWPDGPCIHQDALDWVLYGDAS